jgi:metal-responsive CopG/Arc/MetJ family transcriptional regulator
MKAIRITIDERLLAVLDADDEARRDGRSAVIRRAVYQCLGGKRRAATVDAYRRAHGGKGDPDLEGWDAEGIRPEE